MIMTKINQVEQLADHLYKITEAGSIHCYLILGQKKAVLFDVGYGYEKIEPMIRSITDLPVTVVLSHGDPDHALGSHHWNDVYMHELDYGKMLQNDNQDLKRRALEYRYQKLPITKAIVSMEAFCNTSLTGTKVHFLRDQAVIDLGDRELEVIHIPGHSYGSIALLDKSKKWLFPGDMITHHNIWYFMSADEQAPFSQALNSYRKIKSREADIDDIYSAHGEVGVGMEIVNELIECLEYELEETYQNDQKFYSFAGDGYQHFYKHVNLIYSDERLEEHIGRKIKR